MAIFRGSGGAGDATNDITINRITELSQEAEASATSASSSATSAASSASSASTSATQSATSATNAANSATASASSATTASTAATAAQTAQTGAETAQTAAETAVASIGTSVQDAANSATAAANSASQAATSATNAATSETNASNSASAASISETNATNSATAAASSATSASSAQTAAESARDATLAAYDNFDDRYLGAKASDPTLDNDGNALVAGTLYFDTTNGIMKLYNGSAWVAAYVSIGSLTSDDLPEGSTNLYYTDAKVGSYLTTNSYATQSYVNTATANSTNWDTAYSWGDHSTVGYLTAVPAEYLTQTEGDARYDALGTAVALSIALG